MKYIAFHEPHASIMKWAFTEIARGAYAVEEVWRQARRKGLKCGKTSFWRALENPVYYGKIEVKGYRDEECRLVDGVHDELISEKIFYDVQDAIDSKRKRQRPNVKSISGDNFPLRGFLGCPKCHRMLTASASKGRSGRYHYYHCRSSCGCRYPAQLINDYFVKELGRFKPRKATIKIFKKLLIEEFSEHANASKGEQKSLHEQIEKLNGKLGRARELLLSSDLDSKDYKAIKQEIEQQLVRLEAKLVDTSRNTRPAIRNIEQMTETALETLLNLDSIFIEADSEAKRQIIGSIFPEGLIISEEGCRTTKVNEVAALIYQINSDLYKGKTGTYDENSSKFRLVPRAGVLYNFNPFKLFLTI